jgi:hypothetical protein
LQYTCLHFVVVLKKATHSCINNLVLVSQHLIKFCPHPSQKTIDILSSLHFNTLWTTAEVAVTVFLLEFLAPFCEDPQNLRIFYLDVSIFYLSWRKQRRIFGYFPSDQILSVFLNFDSIFLLLLVPYSNPFSNFFLSFVVLQVDVWIQRKGVIQL